MKRFSVPVGERFGRLVVRGPAVIGKSESWHCVCDCGQAKTAKGRDIRSGRTRSCGCLERETRAAHLRACWRHGGATRKAPHPMYTLWQGMHARCANPANKNYPYYGARGIAVCVRWHEFENFLADMGERPAGRSLDRIDVNGNYSPENCRWATAKEQRQNQRPRKQRAA